MRAVRILKTIVGVEGGVLAFLFLVVVDVALECQDAGAVVLAFGQF